MSDTLWEELARRMEQLYFMVERERSNRMLQYLHEIQDKAAEPVRRAAACLEAQPGGQGKRLLLTNIQRFLYDYDEMREKTSNKFRIYVRGLGNAGKSTLVNALLAIGEDVGSKLDKKPMTFTIEGFSGEIPVDKAVVRYINSSRPVFMTRQTASQEAENEREQFDRSAAFCRREIEKRCKGILDRKEREETADYIYSKYLFQTRIKEITWGIGRNDFLRNCILIDTPGLKQELRFTNVLEDVRSYEADGIIWVFSSEVILSSTVYEQYRRELDEFSNISRNQRIIAVINMHDSELTLGSREWNKLLKRAVQWLKGDFDYVVGVNNRLAYDGYRTHSEELIRSSNIEELKELINRQFVEKSSDDYFKTHIDNLRDFAGAFYSEVEKAIELMRIYEKKYIRAEEQLKAGEANCISICERELREVVEVYMGVVEQRVNENASTVNNLAKMSPYARNNFLGDKIAEMDFLNERMELACRRLAEEIKDRFQALYGQCIIGRYDTASLSRQQFEEAAAQNNEQFVFPEVSVHVLLGSVSGKFWDAYDWVDKNIHDDSFWGLGGILKGIARFGLDVINSAQDPKSDLLKNMENGAGCVRQEYSSQLIKVIRENKNVCERAMDSSISHAIMPYTELRQVLEQFVYLVSSRREIEYRDVTLRDILTNDAQEGVA